MSVLIFLLILLYNIDILGFNIRGLRAKDVWWIYYRFLLL